MRHGREHVQISNTDTLHMLVKDYRAKKKIIFDLELKLMLQVRLAAIFSVAF